jgi:hypothetical protein
MTYILPYISLKFIQYLIYFNYLIYFKYLTTIVIIPIIARGYHVACDLIAHLKSLSQLLNINLPLLSWPRLSDLTLGFPPAVRLENRRPPDRPPKPSAW